MVCTKKKTYCGSDSLKNRIGMAVSIHSFGYNVFFLDLFNRLGLTIDARVKFCLEQKQKSRMASLSKSQTLSFKKARKESQYVKVRQYHAKLKGDMTKGRAYKSGIAMDDEATIVRCKRCKEEGHRTANSKLCKYYRHAESGTMTQNSETITEPHTPMREDVQMENDTQDSTDELDFGETYFDSQVTEISTETSILQEVSLVDCIELTSDVCSQ